MERLNRSIRKLLKIIKSLFIKIYLQRKIKITLVLHFQYVVFLIDAAYLYSQTQSFQISFISLRQALCWVLQINWRTQMVSDANETKWYFRRIELETILQWCVGIERKRIYIMRWPWTYCTTGPSISVLSYVGRL